jgi:hypothetical protein
MTRTADADQHLLVQVGIARRDGVDRGRPVPPVVWQAPQWKDGPVLCIEQHLATLWGATDHADAFRLDHEPGPVVTCPNVARHVGGVARPDPRTD